MAGDGRARPEQWGRTAVALLTLGALAAAAAAAPLPHGVHRGALAAFGIALVALEAVRLLRANGRRRTNTDRHVHVALPAWAAELPPAQYDELANVVDMLARRAQRAEVTASRSRAQASQSREGMWQVVSAAVSSEDQVRRRFVEDLHDSVVQTIIAATYLSDDGETPRSEITEYLREAEKQLRDLMVLTRPPELAHKTLAEVTSRLTMGGALAGLDVTWDWVDADVELPEVCANTLYRFFQESLNNVAKHAGVSTASAGLSVEHGQITAWVQDTGRGFSPPNEPRSTSSGHHVGLELLTSRAAQIGANVLVDSEPGLGTRVTLTMRRPPEGIDRPVPAGTIAA